MSTVYTQHKLSAAFPSMNDAEFQALVIDIRDHGQRDPIITYQGQILDGIHRYRACLECGKEPWIRPEPYSGDDPAGWVLSRNLHRRHLSASQRAGVIVACNEWRSNGDRSSAPVQSSAQMAEAVQVSTRTIDSAKSAESAGLGEMVRAGKIDAKPAAELARKAPEIAARVVAKEITPAQGKAELKDRESKPSPRAFGPSESEKFAELQAEKAKLEAALADKNAEIIALELAGVDEGARNEAMDKMQGYIDAIDNAERMRKAAEALLSEANHKSGELVRANNALDAQNKKLKARIAELEKCAK